MEIWNINGLLDKGIERFKDLTEREICDKIAEFASAKDNNSFVESRLALADRLNAMSEDKITAMENYSIEKEKNGSQEYKYVVQAIAVKHLDNIIDELAGK
ncbi:MAG: hypothetical protein K2N06_02960 [Oscillospiraceae bacterium]|nr:hypothetical protein [Oscillospiraceae bacterium]